MHIKISKNLSAKYHQENKERLKKAREIYQNLSKKNDKMVMNITKISQKTKSKSLLSVEKNNTE